METKLIGTATAVAAGSTINNDTSPFMIGQKVTVMAHALTGAFVGSATLQESDNGTTWTDIAGAVTADAGTKFFTVTLKKHIRSNCTAFTSGSASFTLVD